MSDVNVEKRHREMAAACLHVGKEASPEAKHWIETGEITAHWLMGEFLVAQAIADAEQRGYAVCTADAAAWLRVCLAEQPVESPMDSGRFAELERQVDAIESGSHVGAAKAADGEEG
jgi:hypothetical protein